MASTKNQKSTTYIVLFWNSTNTKIIKEEAYPMHQYTFDEVTEKLKGKEFTCDICESRYFKPCGRYLINGATYSWDGFQWSIQSIQY